MLFAQCDLRRLVLLSDDSHCDTVYDLVRGSGSLVYRIRLMTLWPVCGLSCFTSTLVNLLCHFP